MGAQKGIAEKIIEKGGDYTFSLKGNHSNLQDEVSNYFNQTLEHEEQEVNFKSFEFKEEEKYILVHSGTSPKSTGPSGNNYEV